MTPYLNFIIIIIIFVDLLIELSPFACTSSTLLSLSLSDYFPLCPGCSGLEGVSDDTSLAADLLKPF